MGHYRCRITVPNAEALTDIRESWHIYLFSPVKGGGGGFVFTQGMLQSAMGTIVHRRKPHTREVSWAQLTAPERLKGSMQLEVFLRAFAIEGKQGTQSLNRK